ncbi:hypothetical protein DFH08DRAFT_816747 [Mycena albidolilacea]|uniref:non-specific serine/threonine protein kinase n=1 Tax=Mycena albidolilacea TaxID=1033008 RepID=A0AAD7EJ93_9AGAR|nr:hypothetical protein DFH08DRAFT_816747 [Mycena albidolilacea]
MAPLLYITAFFTTVFILLCACRAEVDLQTYTNNVQSLSEPAKRETPTPDQLGDSELLDIVLVASVDGKFHALNRTTGHTLWSMSSFSSSSTTVSPPSSLAPLVRTRHIDQDPDLTDDNAYQETYIIEPQSGDIYVMATPTSPLQRFPFSMSELVDMSPFSFSAAADDHRVFVGRKETSLLVVELETGNIKATIDSACPWDPFEDLREDDEVDLDELEGSKPPMSKPTEVFIGRTDYHITIHTRPSNKHRIPVQNLSFSTYGPNNQDNILQGSYRNTKDDAYIQSLPNGEIISFKARGESSATEDHSDHSILWGLKFNNPIVAIFDVLRNPTLHNTFVLLQPRPQLSAILPKLTHATSMDQLPHLQSAYIGLVEETGSLFAMSPDRFPLVVFSGGGGGARKPRVIKVIDEGPRELPSDVDAVTEERKRREKAMKERNYGSEDARCLDRSSLYTDRRCLVGIRPLEGGDGDGPENRLKRLIDGAPTVAIQTVMHWDPAENANTNTNTVVTGNGNGTPDGVGDKPGPGPALPGNSTVIEIEGRNPAADDLSLWPSIAFAFVVGALGLWFGFGLGKVRRSGPRPAPVIVDVPTAAVSVLAAPPTPTLPPPEESPPPPSPLTTKKLPPLPLDVAEDADESGDENENENENGDASALPGTKRKGRRGRRAKKKKPGVVDAGENNSSLDLSSEKENLQENLKPIENGLVLLPNGNSSNPLSPSGLSFSPTIPVVAPPVEPSLVVSDHVLGYGSHGTVVYRGSLQGRAVAVKRLLQDFVTLASREVSILQESDDHPNVIRYYYQEAHSNFLYIALELCPATLADLIETPDRDAWRDIAVAFDPKRALRQIAGGLRHLHGLKLVHRDIKPQNILVSAGAGGGAKAYRMLISDFGLCKKLDVDQTSFLPTSHGAMAAGTVGWRAPEILRGDVKLDEMGAGDDASVSSQGSAASGASSGTAGKPARLTKSVDIFALGCLFFYTMTSGGHPFGDRFEREANIMKGAKNLQGLERFGEEGEEAVDLISSMLHADAHERPDTTTCLLHPFFWDPARRLTFLQDASDRFEIMTRVPKEPYLLVLERGASGIVGNDWLSRLDPLFLENLGKFRKYDGRSVQDLLRALRNKKHHYQDLPDKVKRNLGPMPEGFLAYFTRRFPRLFLHVHSVVGDTSLRTESMFRSYFELHD